MSVPPQCKLQLENTHPIFAQRPLQSDDNEAYFAIYHSSFLTLLGTSPSIKLAVEQAWPFAHEAGVYIPSQDAVFVTSNILPNSEIPEVKISKVSCGQDGQWSSEVITANVEMANGGINYNNGILFCAQGSKTGRGGLVHMSTTPPYETRVILDNYHHRLFNSLNDVVVHTDGSIWFTDPIYGSEQGFRHMPQLPCQVYRFDPKPGSIRVVADDFGRPNGLCFSPDESTLYVTDTDWIHGDGTSDDMRARAIYAFDIINRHDSHFLANKRLFATVCSGVPDGIKCDLQGNVYSGCGDGVYVWSPGGVLIGTIHCPGGVANFCFTKKGEMVLLNEARFWVVKLDGSVQGALLRNLGVEVD